MICNAFLKVSAAAIQFNPTAANNQTNVWKFPSLLFLVKEILSAVDPSTMASVPDYITAFSHMHAASQSLRR